MPMEPLTVAALIGLGALHGINPGMGWLFAVALGMQEKRRGAVLAAQNLVFASRMLANESGRPGAAMDPGRGVSARSSCPAGPANQTYWGSWPAVLFQN